MSNGSKRPFFRRMERWLVGLVMEVMAYMLEKAVLRLRSGAGGGSSLNKGRWRRASAKVPSVGHDRRPFSAAAPASMSSPTVSNTRDHTEGYGDPTDHSCRHGRKAGGKSGRSRGQSERQLASSMANGAFKALTPGSSLPRFLAGAGSDQSFDSLDRANGPHF